MATHSKTLANEINQFNIFREHIKSLQGQDQTLIDTMLNQGMIQVSTAHERALADVCGCDVISEDTHDLNDECQTDAKLSTVRWSSKLGKYSAPVGGVANKVGSLKVTVLEPHTGKPYFFHIPRSAYEYIKSNSTNIEIPFDKGGLPARGNRWWKYEEKSFEDLAKNMKDPVQRRLEHNTKFFEELPGTRGGKVPGILSQTKDAIRKREARARQREASAVLVLPAKREAQAPEVKQ